MEPTREGAKLIEFLHLAFLQVLPTRLAVSDYIVKGGANLRLFFNSRRRSQDIDLDYAGNAFWKVEERVDAVLNSRAFKELLRVRGIDLLDLTKSKQTDTTRRWKFAVQRAGSHVNSKIEFSSRRIRDSEVGFEIARTDIGREAGLRAVRANHYLAPAATRQSAPSRRSRSARTFQRTSRLAAMCRTQAFIPGVPTQASSPAAGQRVATPACSQAATSV